MTSIAVLSSVNNFVMLLLFVLFSSATTCLYVVLSETHKGYNDRLETIDNSQSTNSDKTLKIFNVYESLGL